MQLLSEENEQLLSRSLKKKTGLETKLTQQITKKKQEINWIDTIIQFKEELRRVEQQKQDWQIRQEAFSPRQEKLKRTTNTLELAGEYATLESIRRSQKLDYHSRGEYLKEQPTRDNKLKVASAAKDQAKKQLAAKKEEQKDSGPLIIKARELDLKVREKASPIKDAGDAVAEQSKFLKALYSTQRETGATLEGQRKTLEDVLKHLNETKTDEGLVEHLTGISERFEIQKDLEAQHKGKLSKISEVGDQLTEATRTWKDLTKSLSTCQSTLKSCQNAVEHKLLEYRNTLEDRELSDWHESLASLRERKSCLERIIQAKQELNKLDKTLDKLSKRNNELASKESTLTNKLQAQIESRGFLEKQQSLQETQLYLFKKIEGFKEDRCQLEDGKPCPLCGAEEHPFAKGNIPLPNETNSALNKTKTQLKQAIGAVTELKVKKTEVKKDLEQVAADEKAHSERITELKTLIRQTYSAPSFETIDQDLGQNLQKLQNENTRELDHTTKVVQAADSITKVRDELRNSSNTAKEAAAKTEREVQAAEYKMDTAKQLLQRLNTETETLLLQLKKSRTRLQGDVSAYGVEIVSFDTLDNIRAQLIDRRAQWLSLQEQKTALDLEISKLDSRNRHQQEQIQKYGDEINKQQKLLNNLTNERDALLQERHKSFCDKNPNDEEQRLSTAVEAENQKLEITRNNLDTATQELSG